MHMRQAPEIATVAPCDSGAPRRGWRYDRGVKVILFRASGMLHVARHGAAKRVLENADIADIADTARGGAAS